MRIVLPSYSIFYRTFLIVYFLLGFTIYDSVAQETIVHYVCPDETYSKFSNNSHRAPRGDSECFEGQTEVRAVGFNPQVGTVTYSRIDNNGGSFGARFEISWMQNGIVTVEVEYRRVLSHIKWGFFGPYVKCDRTEWDHLDYYQIHREPVSLGALFDGDDDVKYVPNDNVETVFNFMYHPTESKPDVRVTRIKYFNGKIYDEHPILQPVRYSVTGKDDYQLITEVYHEYLDNDGNVTCGKWVPMQPKTLSVRSSCFLDSFENIHISPVGLAPGDTIIYKKPEAYGLKSGKTYTLVVEGSTDFMLNYKWNFTDFGRADLQINGSSFTIPPNFDRGSYRISVTPNVKDCATPKDIPILIDIANKRIENTCTIVLPQDIKKWFREFSPNDNILQHIAGYIQSERSIIINPGISLELGAELFLEYPDTAPEEDDPDINMNFVEQTSYDEYGRVSASTRSYFDKRGIPLQTQSKNLSTEVILANATLYDAYGRPAISTLASPVQIPPKNEPIVCSTDRQVGAQINFQYKPDFIKATSTQVYSNEHFDIIDAAHSNELAPSPVDASTRGTLGWYYSANNDIEPLVATTQYPYSRTLYLHDGTGSVKGVTKPGNAFKAGSNYLATADIEPVSSNDPYFNATTYNSYLKIRNKELGFSNPASIDGEFFKTVSKDESANKSITYTDKSGHVIIALYFGDQTNPITKSFSYYDNAGRIIASISPNGLDQYTGNNYAEIDKTTYSYNSKGQLMTLNEKIAGGNAINGISKTEYVYRKDGSIRFSQNEEQRRASPQRYSYTNYDRSGRPIESGEYSMISTSIGIGFKTDEMISALEKTNANGGLPEAGDSEATLTNIGVKKERTYTYYDEPDALIPVNTDLNISRNQHFLNGAVSRTKKVNYNPDLLPEEDHVISWYSYDERGRVEWIVQDITGLGVKTIDYRYGPTGQVQEVTYQKGHDSEYVNGSKDQFVHFYEYDADGRLKKVYTSRELLVYNIEGKLMNKGITYNDVTGELNNPGLLELQATYYYYMHGPLKRVELGNKLQGIDYVYTVDGALKGINNASPSSIPDATTNKIKDPGQDGNGNGFKTDVFGMSIDYYKDDYLRADGNVDASTTIPGNPDLYTGLIKATRWHCPTDPGKQFVYAYQYDKRNQFKQANWGEVDSDGNFQSSGLNYLEAVTGDGALEGYDANGNIKRLKRYADNGVPIADFSYNYRTYTNILESISQGNETFRTYTCDNLGRTVKEEEGDKSKFITYDVTGKVKGVYADNALTKPITTFAYDDKGFRLNKVTYNEFNEALLRTWYMRDATGNIISTYEEYVNVPQPIKLSEVPVYGDGRIGMYNKTGIMLYELTDNLGNVRAVIGDTITAEYIATMEEGEQADIEVNDYEFNIKRSIAPENINHTPENFTVDGKNYHVENPNQVNRINNKPLGVSNPDPIGTGIMLNVHPGDIISTEVFAKYANFKSTDHNIVTGLASFLTTTFSSPLVIKDAIFNVVNTTEFNSSSVWLKLNDSQPRAFLNYLLFDNNFKLQKFDFDQVTSAAQIPTSYPYVNNHERLALENITIEKEGFIYIYVSNQSDQNMDVYFDDLRVTYTSSNIVSGGDFYPYGLPIADRQITRDPYRNGYQGKFSEKDDETGWNHFELREYDPIIGRWISPDPMRQFPSSYVGMGNDPVNGVDPTGGCTDSNGNVIPCPDGVQDGLDGFHTIILDDLVVAPDNPSPWQVGTEWLSGTGPRDRAFMDGDMFTEMLQQHSHVEDTRNIIRDGLANGKELPGSNPYGLGGIEGVGKYLKDYSTLATGGMTGNLAVTYLGSYNLKYTVTNVDVQNRTATVHFSVNNSSTIQSATRPPVIGYTTWWRNNIGNKMNDALKSGPMSTTTQTFDWTETIKY